MARGALREDGRGVAASRTFRNKGRGVSALRTFWRLYDLKAFLPRDGASFDDTLSSPALPRATLRVIPTRSTLR